MSFVNFWPTSTTLVDIQICAHNSLNNPILLTVSGNYITSREWMLTFWVFALCRKKWRSVYRDCAILSKNLYPLKTFIWIVAKSCVNFIASNFFNKWRFFIRVVSSLQNVLFTVYNESRTKSSRTLNRPGQNPSWRNPWKCCRAKTAKSLDEIPPT